MPRVTFSCPISLVLPLASVGLLLVRSSALPSFQAHLVYFLLQSWKQPSLRGALVPLRMTFETKSRVPGVLISTGVSFLLGLSADRARRYMCVSQCMQTHVSINTYLLNNLYRAKHEFIRMSPTPLPYRMGQGQRFLSRTILSPPNTTFNPIVWFF